MSLTLLVEDKADRKAKDMGDGKSVDLVATKHGNRIAIEIETGKSNVEGNLKKCEEADVDKVVTVHSARNRNNRVCSFNCVNGV